MKIVEILEIENANTGCINLFKEGICWKVYEKSAWRFVKNIREYKVFRKYLKTLKQDIAFLAFPESGLQEILPTVCTRHPTSNTFHKSEIFIEIQGFTETVGFEEWKAKIKVTGGNEKSKDLQITIDEVKKQLQRHFELNEKHFDKLQKTLSENSAAINTINIALTNITQMLNQSLVISNQ